MSETYFSTVFTVKINLPSRYLGPDIDKNLETSVKERYEGQCYQGVFIKPSSIKMKERTVGQIVGSRFTGDMTYRVLFECLVYKPVIGSVVDAFVVGKNNAGILAKINESEIPMKIFLSKNQHGETAHNFEKIGENHPIKVKLLNYEVQYNQLFAIGLLVE